LATLVEDAVLAVRDEHPWKQAVAREKAMKDELLSFVSAWKEEHNGKGGV